MKRIVSMMMVLVVAGCGQPSMDKSGRVQTVVALTGDTTRGATVFTNQCGVCHGPMGDGLNDAPSLKVHVPLHNRTQMADVILNGEGTMAPLPQLTNQQIVDVIDYCKATFK